MHPVYSRQICVTHCLAATFSLHKSDSVFGLISYYKWITSTFLIIWIWPYNRFLFLEFKKFRLNFLQRIFRRMFWKIITWLCITTYASNNCNSHRTSLNSKSNTYSNIEQSTWLGVIYYSSLCTEMLVGIERDDLAWLKMMEYWPENKGTKGRRWGRKDTCSDVIDNAHR